MEGWTHGQTDKWVDGWEAIGSSGGGEEPMFAEVSTKGQPVVG